MNPACPDPAYPAPDQLTAQVAAQAPGAAAATSATLTITAQDWQPIEACVIQRARLLDRVMADVYGSQQLLAQGLLPPALVLGHPGYLRALHGIQPVGARHLHIAAFDLAQGPHGNGWVVSAHTQAPSGLGRLLKNRLAHLPPVQHAFERQPVRPLDDSYRALVASLQTMRQAGPQAHFALLTPGPYNNAYLEHAQLARTLGLSLVEGSDLIVRDQHLCLNTLHGMVTVHGLLTQLDDLFLDPLELRADSTLGVPGLLQAMRAGNLLVANAPGSAFLESPALQDYLPALTQHLLGEVMCQPTVPKAVTLRVFAVSNGPHSWRVLPGGLAGLADGNSADVWVLTDGAVDPGAPAQPSHAPPREPPRKPLITRRAAENLYWLGRYTERAENTVRLAHLTLEALAVQSPLSAPLLTWLGRMAISNTLVLPGVPLPTELAQTRREFERALITSLVSNDQATSVGYNLRALRLAAAAVRERLSQDLWTQVQHAEEALFQRCAQHPASGGDSTAQALATLRSTSDHLADIANQQMDRMAHDDGWHLLNLGRHIERLGFIAHALRTGLETGSVRERDGFGAMLALLDSTNPWPLQDRHSHDMACVLTLLVLDPVKPRALAAVVHTLRAHLDGLAGGAPDPFGLLKHSLPDPAQWQLGQLCGPGSAVGLTPLDQLLHDCSRAAQLLAHGLTATCFTHDGEGGLSLGA